MLTIEDIKKKVNTFSSGKPVEELIEEIIVMYKIEKGLEDINNGYVTDWEDFKEEMKSWSKSA
jgi:hypothetical protein